jgi:hypothetical protein
MQQGWNLNDEGEWEKVRFTAYFIANGQFFGKPTRSIQDILELPSIDGNKQTYYDKLKEKILQKRKEMAPLK